MIATSGMVNENTNEISKNVNVDENNKPTEFLESLKETIEIKKIEGLIDEKEKIENSKEKKEKRKSKFNTEGRCFKCEICDKAYLSYPALYIHTKTKHSLNKINLHSIDKDKKRGRPKKNVIMN